MCGCVGVGGGGAGRSASPVEYLENLCEYTSFQWACICGCVGDGGMGEVGGRSANPGVPGEFV